MRRLDRGQAHLLLRLFLRPIQDLNASIKNVVYDDDPPTVS
jgi:hypothetical protein